MFINNPNINYAYCFFVTVVFTKRTIFTIVKKYISILFLSITIFCSNSEFLELAKLPILIEHFNEHQQWDSKISFWGFMYMHYFEKSNKYGDYSKDMEMPFKMHDHSFASIMGFLVPPINYAITSKYLPQDKEQKQVTNSSAYSSYYLTSIWQPPKFC